ncbi:peroxisomal N(1)-acetyl-spermine/spermidine oxidase-like [Leptopilina heterotoma]|uniref:peroxisomal N(1)-acetyl-spermine/spermidine oxidase-like n=1 Tax=Leptopilina heterotoma TaxID=63436 RepID=UPI001CA97A01|nr:peroxisomal N(1)-acetyl-spermine/spermidine oxidase-like [Leptopilina heterotoma]
MLLKKNFFTIALLFLYSIILSVNCDDDQPSVIIVGAGASGIAAASKLMQNGFKNVKILEAEDRIGGRIFTKDFGDKKVELGAQWVHGVEGNVVYELAAPHGVLDKGDGEAVNMHEKMMNSEGNVVNENDVKDVNEFTVKVEDELVEHAKTNKNSPLGDYYENKIDKYVEAHPVWKDNKKGFTHIHDMIMMSIYAANSWDEVSTAAVNDFHNCPGEFFVNWKTNGYKTILDILMKRFPKPEEELPVMANTVLNAEVESIDYSDPNGKVTVKTTNGDTHTADHVIVTCSVGVLKDKHKSMFKPALPEDKQKAIEGTGYGNAAKVYLSYDVPWWKEDMEYGFGLLWLDKDLEMLEKDVEKKWIMGMVGVYAVEHKPNLLQVWVSGEKNTMDMEKLTDDQVKTQVVDILKRFFGKTHTVTEPTGMMRSKWHSNKHFMGTYSFRDVKSDQDVVNPTKLAEPVVGNGKPVVMFAGEATSPHHFGSVHGAIETGWREADRIMKEHPNVKN